MSKDKSNRSRPTTTFYAPRSLEQCREVLRSYPMIYNEVATWRGTCRFQLEFEITKFTQDWLHFLTSMLIVPPSARAIMYAIWMEGDLSRVQPHVTKVELKLWRGIGFWMFYLFVSFWIVFMAGFFLTTILATATLVTYGVIGILLLLLWWYALQSSEKYKRKLAEIIVERLGHIERYEYFEPEVIA